MKNWTVQQKIQAGFWLLSLLPLLLGVMAYRTAHRLADAAVDVADTNERVKVLEQLIGELNFVEASQREYILTGEQRHLQVTERARANVDAAIKRLRQLGTQPDWMDLLEPIIPQKFEEIRKTVELRNSEGIEAASQVILANRGAQAMDDIRRVTRRMILNENTLLGQRSRAQNRDFKIAMALLAVLLVLNVGLISGLSFLIRRDAAERRREEEHIRRLNAELELRVEQRTEALRHTNEDLEQFNYFVSHDLQEPLRTVSNYTELLARRYRDQLDEDARTYINFVTEGSKRMSALIKDLLEYSRAADSPEESLNTLDSEAVLQGVLDNLAVAIAESDAEVTHDLLPNVTYDEMRLAQLFQNLIGNAIKYRGERAPRIHIFAEAREREVVFAVRDNGIGIDAEHLDKIFGIFQRLHGREYQGTGIGLAMCKKIVERYGGRIWVESRKGEGSTFYFSVPQRRPVAVAAAGT